LIHSSAVVWPGAIRITFPCPTLPTIKVPSGVEVMLSGNIRVPGSVISVLVSAAWTAAASASKAPVESQKRSLLLTRLIVFSVSPLDSVESR
jgi:hypothetical protein